MSHLFGIRSVRQLSTLGAIRSSMHLFWLFRRRPDSTSWTLTPVTLVWVVSLSQIQGDVECVVAYCSRALRPSQWRHCTTKREMLAAVAMCIQLRSYLCEVKFTLPARITSHWYGCIGSRTWRAWWPGGCMLYNSFNIHRSGRDHGNADGLSRVPSSPCRQCTRPDCPPAVEITECADQPFDSESTGSSEDTDLIPIHSGEDWVALLDDDLSQPSAIAGDSFRISALQKEDPVCITLSSWISSGVHGRRSEECTRSCNYCGIIVITLQ